MRKQRLKVVSDINVTPLVDVILVLLIIFIITSPFMRSGAKVNLPRAAVRQPQSQRAVLVTVDRTGQAFVNSDRVALSQIGSAVATAMQRSPGLPVLIEGDGKAEYGNIVRVMDMIRQAGVENVGLVLESAAIPETP